MNKLVVLATVCLIGAHGDPDPQEREVNPLSSLQQQQPAPSWNFQYGGAQGFANPYMRLSFGQPQPAYNPYMPQMPPTFGVSGGLNWNGGYPQIGGSAGYYPYGTDYGNYPNNGIESSTSKPNYETPEYEDDEDEPTSGKVEIIENGNNIQNNGLNWNQPSWNQPWSNGGMSYGPPQWSQSYTPVGGGCYNRCKPSCSFRPPPPPPPPPMPRPRPMPLPIPRPRPMPQPAKPTYGCRSQCRPMCNQTPTCGGGASFNGNTMVCNRNRPQPSYNQGLYGGYGNYNSMYGGMMNTLPAKDPRSQPVAAKSVEAEAVVPSEEEEAES